MSSILVTGASGQLGRLVTRKLIERGVSFVAGSRDPSKLDLPGETRRVDFDDVPSLDAAFAGIDRLLLISTDALGAPGARAVQHGRAIEAAKRAGVKHIVYTSLAKADPGNPIGIVPDHAGTEAALKDSGLGYTALRNALYAEVLLGALPHALAEGVWRTATGQGAAGVVTRDDCAEAAVAALTDGFEGRRVLEITGPEALTYDRIAAIVAKAAGKPLVHQAIPPEALANGLVAAGFPKPVADLFVSFDVAVATGWMPASPDFEALTGRKATSIEAFFRDNVAALG